MRSTFQQAWRAVAHTYVLFGLHCDFSSASSSPRLSFRPFLGLLDFSPPHSSSSAAFGSSLARHLLPLPSSPPFPDFFLEGFSSSGHFDCDEVSASCQRFFEPLSSSSQLLLLSQTSSWKASLPL